MSLFGRQRPKASRRDKSDISGCEVTEATGGAGGPRDALAQGSGQVKVVTTDQTPCGGEALGENQQQEGSSDVGGGEEDKVAGRVTVPAEDDPTVARGGEDPSSLQASRGGQVQVKCLTALRIKPPMKFKLGCMCKLQVATISHKTMALSNTSSSPDTSR